MADGRFKLDFRDDRFRAYATGIGEVILAWNDLHETLSSLFWVTLGIPNGLIPAAVWYSSKSDLAQRDMLEAALKVKAIGHPLETRDTFRKEIIWLVSEINKIADKRNDFVHSPVILLSTNEPTPAHHLGHKRAKKLSKKNLVGQASWFYDATIICRDYAADLNKSIGDRNTTLPERPKLPNRGDPSYA